MSFTFHKRTQLLFGTSTAPLEMCGVILLVLISTIAVSLRPAGFVGGGWDDIQYVNAASKWLSTFPYIGVTHWELRHPFVLQLAAMMATGARAAKHLLLVPLAWYAAVVVISYAAIRRMVDPLAAFYVTALLASTPAIAAAGMALLPDLIEFGFILAGMFIVLIASQRPLSPAVFCACGICIGLGWLTRETSGAAVLFLFLSFVFYPLFDRRSYLIIGAAACLCVAAETVWLAYSTGDLLYRAHVDMRHVLIPSGQMSGSVAPDTGAPIFNSEIMKRWLFVSPISTNWILDPYVSLFTSRSYGLLFYAALPAAFYLFRAAPDKATATTARTLMALGLLWFVFAVYVLAIRPQARYFFPLIYGAVSAVGIYLAIIWQRRRAVSVALFSALVASNILLCDFQQFRNHVVDALVRYAAHSREPIHISEATMSAANIEVVDPGLPDRVTTSSPMIGDILLLAPGDRHSDTQYMLCDDGAFASYTPRPYLIGIMAQAVGLDSIIPRARFQRLLRPSEEIVIGRRCG